MKRINTSEQLEVGQWYWFQPKGNPDPQHRRPYEVKTTSGIKYVNANGMRMWCDRSNDQVFDHYDAWGPIPREAALPAAAPTQQHAPLPVATVIEALRAMDAEARKRGAMYPQTYDEQQEDKAAIRNVIASLEFYGSERQRRPDGGPSIAGWPSIDARHAAAELVSGLPAAAVPTQQPFARPVADLLKQALDVIEAGPHAEILMNVEGVKSNLRAALSSPAPAAAASVQPVAWEYQWFGQPESGGRDCWSPNISRIDPRTRDDGTPLRNVRALVYASPIGVEAAASGAMSLKVTEDMHVAAVKVLQRAHGLDGLPQRMLDAMLAVARGRRG
jgi:hypothetical protein